MATLLAVIYVSFIGLGLPASVLGSAWPQMRVELGASLSMAGYLSMTITACTAAASVLGDRLVRRFGVGKVTAGSVLLAAVALAGFAAAPKSWFLFVCAIPLGLSAGALDVTLNNFVALHFTSRHMNWLHCFWGIGASAGPVILAAAMGFGTWRLGYGLIAILQTVLCVLLFLVSPLWKRAGERHTTAGAGKESQSHGILGRQAIVPLLGGFALYCAAETSAGLWGASFLDGIFHLSAAETAMTSTIYFGALTVGRLLAGLVVSDRVSDRSMIRSGFLIALAGAVLTALSGTPRLAWTGIALMGLGLAPVYPCMLHATPYYFGAERSQKIMGMEMAAAYVGSTCFSPLFGALTEYFTVGLYPWYLMVCLLLGILCIEVVQWFAKRM